ncbi:peptidylprolyl isomerase [Parvularcula dongshanensis]|uniref:Parvulin-like PPIase n=1 Tax=Parvularcula dongshanensis TaxID=1173995 RepID=A0A840I502_9PROT|nr:peptidylprolyl isomerase [Parvularcula dongshanensis]MBB4659361.1 peptidyl-prolyl cis-trans isomerase SurA [Parvularcula dongshanensis]
MRALLTAILAGTAALGAAAAQDEQPEPRPQVGTAVAAVVNDDPISTFDVQQRVRLMMATAGAQLPEGALEQMQGQALRDLIEERLKLSEAERLEFTVSDEEVNAELERIASSGGGTVAELERDLAQQGIALDSLRERIRADITWEQLVRGRYSSRVNVTDEEVEDVLTDLRARTQDEQFLVSEICLPLDDPSQAQQMQQVGFQMIEQMRQGVPFRALAQQFSACPSAARGGDLGWMRASEMRPEIAQLASTLEPGSVSAPVPSGDMLVLLAMRERRSAAQAGERSYEVAYAGAPMSVGRDTAAAAFDRLRLTNACNAETLSVDLGEGIGVTALPMLPESAFEAPFRPALSTLQRGETSDLIESNGAYHAVMMCARDEGLGLPSRSQIENQLYTEALDRISRRYLRDVERDSAVQMRLGTGG